MRKRVTDKMVPSGGPNYDEGIRRRVADRSTADISEGQLTTAQDVPG